jgi:hypothetical protein
MIHPRSKKPWSALEGEYEYDVDRMPERYEFGWADDSSIPFEGYPIEIQASYVKKGQIEQIKVDGFSTDIDFMLACPANFNNDNNVLVAAFPIDPGTNSGFRTFVKKDTKPQFRELRVEEKYGPVTYSLQNGFLSFADLVPKYYVYNLPSLNALINNELLIDRINDWDLPEDLKPGKFKTQKISIPIGADDANTLYLIRTSLGLGTIDEMKINLSSRLAEITLLHDLD